MCALGCALERMRSGVSPLYVSDAWYRAWPCDAWPCAAEGCVRWRGRVVLCYQFLPGEVVCVRVCSRGAF